MQTDDQVLKVSTEISNLLDRLLGGVLPPEPDLSRPLHVTWSSTHFSKTVSAETADDEYRLRLVETYDEYLIRPRCEWKGPLQVNFEDGSILLAETAFQDTSQSIPNEPSESTLVWTDLVAPIWSWRQQDASAVAWYGAVKGRFTPFFGNVSLITPTRTSRDVFRILGQYTYYLAAPRGRQDHFFFVIDTNAGEPSQDVIYGDFLILQFLLGQRLRMDRLVGVDKDGKVVSVIGGRFGEEQSKYALAVSPIPLGAASEDLVPFFEALSRTYRDHPEWQLFIPLGYYIDSLSNHLDGGYLTIHVALEAFAFWLLTDNGQGPVIVRNKNEWNTWVKEQKDRIAGMAIEGFENILVNNVRGARYASSRIVATAFKRLGLALTEEMECELKRRNDVVHKALMAPIDDRDPRHDRRRQAIVRTMLVALLAKAVGFTGEIRGWERSGNSDYLPAPSDWWIVDVAAVRAATTYYEAVAGHTGT